MKQYLVYFVLVYALVKNIDIHTRDISAVTMWLDLVIVVREC